MGTKNLSKLKKMSAQELAMRILEGQKELFETKMKHVLNQLEDTAKLWRLRKEMARAKTLQTQLKGAVK